jgi:hypothetical protein
MVLEDNISIPIKERKNKLYLFYFRYIETDRSFSSCPKQYVKKKSNPIASVKRENSLVSYVNYYEHKKNEANNILV